MNWRDSGLWSRRVNARHQNARLELVIGGVVRGTGAARKFYCFD